MTRLPVGQAAVCVADQAMATYLANLLTEVCHDLSVTTYESLADAHATTGFKDNDFVIVCALSNPRYTAPRLKLGPVIRTTIFSYDLGWPAIEAATHSGADSYVYALSSTDEHRRAFELILSGHVYFPFRELATGGMSHRALPTALTSRQTEVLSRLCLGRTNAQISHELGISPNTVRLHISAVMKAFGAHNRTSVVAAVNGSMRDHAWHWALRED